MSNLGHYYLGESEIFNKTVKNASLAVQNASYIRFSVVDSDENLYWETLNISAHGSGFYTTDIYLDNSSFDEGQFYGVWDGYFEWLGKLHYFYYEDNFYIEENKLLSSTLAGDLDFIPRLGMPGNITTVNTTYTITLDDYTILCDATAATFTVNLPSPSSCNGWFFNIKKIDTSVNPITLGNAGPNATIIIVINEESVTVQSNGSLYYII